MKKSRFTEQQIIGFLKEAEAGFPIADLCRREGFGVGTVFIFMHQHLQNIKLPPSKTKRLDRLLQSASKG